MTDTAQTYTEAGTSRMVRIREEELDLNIHYNDTGAGDEVVIMLHGSGPGATSWANFSRNVDSLANAGYRVILMDSPGWGKSDPIVSTGSRSDLNATALKGLMDALNIEKAHLIGNSMGGHSAVAFTLRYPERAGKLLLMGGGTGGVGLFTAMPTEGIKRLQGLSRDPTLENLKQMMDIFVFDSGSLTEELFQARLDNILARRDHLENFVRSIEANPRQFPDFTARLGEISQECLILWGREDRFVPMETGLRLLAGLPKAELHVFNRCGHWVQWEHADKFNRLALDFFQH